jgi:TolA-binding protein
MLRAGMKRERGVRAVVMAACAMAACASVWSGEASAQTAPSSADLSHVLTQITQQEQRLNAQERLLNEQQRQLTQQRALIEQQRHTIEAMSNGSAVSDETLGEVRGTGVPSNALGYTPLAADEPIMLHRPAPVSTIMQADAGGGSAPASTETAQNAPPTAPVGEAPPEQPHTNTVEALPEGQNALLGHGRLVIEPSFEYDRSSSNRLVFRGVEIVSGVQIGLIDANDTAQDTLVGTLAARYAVTDRLEVEARVPYMYRNDRVTTLSQNNQTTTQTFNLEGSDLGDIEMSVRYQLNRGKNGTPLYVAGLRVKSDSGTGPFDVARDSQGVATQLATGSGFWAAQGSISVLYPTDPAVIYMNLSYLYNVGRDIDQTYGTVTVGHVKPGDSIGLGFGFGFALNPRFSFSLGYSHSFVMETDTELNGTTQVSPALQVGALDFGMSFRASPTRTIAANVDVGVTRDAPDVRVTFRMPMSF